MGLSAGPGIELQGPAGAAMDAEAPPPAGAHSSSAAKSLGALELETRSGPQGSLQASEEGKSMQGVDDAELEAEAQRHSTWRTCVGHIITAVIGAGVLSLSYSVAVLGWIAGLCTIVVFAAITLYTSRLLADVYILDGRRMSSYMDAVRTSMGPRHATIIACVQYSNLALTGIAYNITAATSMQAVACPSGGDTCSVDYWVFAVAFGCIQLVVSQLPNLDSLWWISALGTIMSFGYSISALILSSYYMAAYGAAGGDVGGIPMSSSDKAFAVMNAMGNIIFAYSFSMILIEIAETIKTDAKGPVWHMRKAVDWSLGITSFFYLSVASVGYAAFGNRTCEDILTCFSKAPDGSPSSVPSGVIQAVNVMVCIHLVPAFAIFTQPVFAFVEGGVARSRRLNAWLPARLNPARRSARWAFRLTFRSLYVVVVATVAVALPFFSAIVGLVGALGFWPATVAYPVAMYIRKHNPKGRQRALLHFVDLFSLLVSILAVIGSVRSLFGGSPATPDYTAFDDVVPSGDTFADVMN